eukprot:13538779-Alexandrium_andersonii.AAC.1
MLKGNGGFHGENQDGGKGGGKDRNKWWRSNWNSWDNDSSQDNQSWSSGSGTGAAAPGWLPSAYYRLRQK